MRSTPSGVGRLTGPAMTVVLSPASRAARASAKPIFPELLFVSIRTGSSISTVGPAVITQRGDFSVRRGARASSMSPRSSLGSSIRPSPEVPQARSPEAGPQTFIPRLRITPMFSCVAGFRYIAEFIAGATASFCQPARTVVERRSSAIPARTFARKFPVAGAMTMMSAHSAALICSIGSLPLSPSHMGSFEVRALRTVSVTKSSAWRVTMACTSAPLFLRSLISSQHL